VCGNVCVFQGTFEKGWTYTPKQFVPFFRETFPKDPLGPDALVSDPPPTLWPDTAVLPFHYPHPVTGRWHR
jgi:hypothetical protein